MFRFSSVLLFVLFICRTSTGNADITIYAVRHAEKQSAGKDPALSESGQQRAAALSQTLRSVKFAAAFVSQFQRTQQTVAPTLRRAKIASTQHPAGQEHSLAALIRRDFTGKSVLFAGHSNTVPSLLKHLGITDPPKLSESDYDNLFIIRIDDTGKSSMIQLHYGAANRASEPSRTPR